MIKSKLVFILIPFLVLITTFGIWNVFFQQDEWYWFGQALVAQKIGVASLIKVDGFHFNPFYPLSFYEFFSIFHLDWHPYAYYSIVLHGLNAFLVFFLIKRIMKNIYIAFLATVFFILANVSQQAVTWYGASLNVLPAATLGLVSLHFFYSYYQFKKIRYLLFSYAFLILGLGFKEDIMFLFAVYPLCFLLFKQIKEKKVFMSTLFIGLLYLLFRGIVQKFGAENPLSHISLIDYGITIVKNIIVIPLMSFSQLFVSPLMIYNFGRFITKGHEHFFLQFSPINNIEIFIETTFFTTLTIFLTILFLGVLGLVTKQTKNKKEKKVLFLLIIYTIGSFTSFFLLPKGFGMESRHYYFPTVGAASLLAFVIVTVWKRIRRVNIRYILLGCLLLYLFYNYLLDREQLQLVIDLSRPRVAFIQQIQKLYHNVPSDAIFLSQAEYLPFQSGTGQMLMVLFDNRHQFDNLLSGYVLWDMGSQGYIKKMNTSFGYFSDQSLLKKVVLDNSISMINIYSFSWDNKSMQVHDTSQNTRKELSSNE